MKALCDWIDALPLSWIEAAIIFGVLGMILLYPYRIARLKNDR
jgi:hypothetical protein